MKAPYRYKQHDFMLLSDEEARARVADLDAAARPVWVGLAKFAVILLLAIVTVQVLS